ncbi:MAG: Dyp-type peroxidase [Solirubrobacteraceae bacterium]
MTEVGRRTFLTRSAVVLGGAGVGALAAAGRDDSASAAGGTASVVERATEEQLSTRIAFNGRHQAGILNAAPAEATLVALDSVAPNRAVLAQALQVLSRRARQLTQGGVIPLLEAERPPADSGILGPSNAPDRLTVTIAFGASLFDDRYGLAARRPKELIPMPAFSVDDLDPKQTHGDVLVQICAAHRDTVVHTVRELLRAVRGSLQLHWTIDGFQSARRDSHPRSSKRNLFAFRDGTGNPETTDPHLMDELVWTGSDEPAWAAGGTYQVVRLIRMHVEFWDRVGLNEQQRMIGRDRNSGAPLGGTFEHEDPRYDLDRQGDRIPLDAHIRLANPRTKPTAPQRILRRGYNYTRGYDAAGQLDQGLAFVAFNQSPARQFATIQQRLADEPMVDYITPFGGGYFFVPPGAPGDAAWVGSRLFDA